MATAVPLPLELEIDLITVRQLLALVIQGQRLIPQAGLEVAETGVFVVIQQSAIDPLQRHVEGGDPDLVVVEQGIAAGLDLALAAERNIQLDRALHGPADLDLPQRLADGVAHRRILQIVADGLALAGDPGVHVEMGARGQRRDPGMHRVGAGLAEPGGAAVHVEAGVLEQQIDLQVGERLPTGEELEGRLLERHRHLEDAGALIVGEVPELAVPEQVGALGLAPLDGPAQVVHQAVTHHGQRVIAIGMARVLDVDAAGQGEEGVLEQIEPEAAGETQIRVVQGDVLAIEHPACRRLPPIQPRRQAVDRDRLLEVARRIHLALAEAQAGAAARRGQPEFAVQVLQARHIPPGLHLEAREPSGEGEPLPVRIRLQDQILQLALGLGALEGLSQAGIETRDQLAQAGDLADVDGGHIALDAFAHPLELQPAVQPGRAIELEDHIMAGELPLLPRPPQLDLAAAQIEPVWLSLDLVLPDQMVVAKGQQRVPQLAVGKVAPQLEVELARHLGLAAVDPGQHGADVELAGPQIELATEAAEPRRGGVYVQDEIDGALAHPVDEIGLAHALVTLAAVLPAQLGDVEGTHLTQRRGHAQAAVMNVEGGELGQQEAQQGPLLIRALLAGRGGRLRQIQRHVAVAQQQLAEHRLPVVEGAPEVEVGPHLAKAQGEAPRIGGDGEPLQLESRAALGPAQPDMLDAHLQLAVAEQGGDQRLPVLVEQGAAKAYHADQDGQQHEEDPEG
ncbi:hypothetical protein D3C79_604120 [compost metagenome]